MDLVEATVAASTLETETSVHFEVMMRLLLLLLLLLLVNVVASITARSNTENLFHVF